MLECSELYVKAMLALANPMEHVPFSDTAPSCGEHMCASVPAYIDSHCFVLETTLRLVTHTVLVPSDQLETKREFSVRAFLVVQQGCLGR